MTIVEWGVKERNAEIWKQRHAYDLDEPVEEIVEDMDKREEGPRVRRAFLRFFAAFEITS